MKTQNFKKFRLAVISAVTLLTITGVAKAQAQTDVNLIDTSNGVWVSVFENGMPVENALVNQNYHTDYQGRVFIHDVFSNKVASRITVQTPTGEIIQKYAPPAGY